MVDLTGKWAIFRGAYATSFFVGEITSNTKKTVTVTGPMGGRISVHKLLGITETVAQAASLHEKLVSSAALMNDEGRQSGNRHDARVAALMAPYPPPKPEWE